MHTTPFTSSSSTSKAIPLWRWLLLALGGGLLLGWGVLQLLTPYQFNGMLIQSPHTVTDFTLTGGDNVPVSLSDFRGQVVLLYFGYTYCPDACPATMAELARMVELLGKKGERVQVILVSVDPLRDTPTAVQAYASLFHPSFIGLTGSEDALMQATVPLGIYYEKREGSVAAGYLVDHTATVAVIDPAGYLRLLYPFNTPADAMAADVLHLLK